MNFYSTRIPPMNRIHNHACHNQLPPPLSIIIPWIRLRKRLLSEEKGDGRGRIIPVRGINLLFRDTHSNAAVRDLKSGCSSAPFPRLRDIIRDCESLSLFSYFIMTFLLSLFLFFLLILSPLSEMFSQDLEERYCFNASEEIETLASD